MGEREEDGERKQHGVREEERNDGKESNMWGTWSEEDEEGGKEEVRK